MLSSDGKKIIGGAFYMDLTLTEFRCPEGVEEIGIRSFNGCARLQRVTLPKSLRILKRSAFSRCHSLTEITFFEGMYEIEENVFFQCVSLRHVRLVAGIRRLGKAAFARCSSITEVELKKGMEGIDENAFALCGELSRVDMAEGIRYVDRCAFYGCQKVTSLEFKDGLRDIGEYAFFGCSALSNLKMVKGVRTIGKAAFFQNVSLTELTLEEGIETIDSAAFGECVSLKSVTVPLENLRLLHRNAFVLDAPPSSTGPPLQLDTLRVTCPFSLSVSFPFPNVANEHPVDFIQSTRDRVFRDEVRIARTIYFALFVIKRLHVFLYNLDRGNRNKAGPVSKRLCSYWFRGRCHRAMFPIRGAGAFRDRTRHIELDSAREGSSAATSQTPASESATKREKPRAMRRKRSDAESPGARRIKRRGDKRGRGFAGNRGSPI